MGRFRWLHDRGFCRCKRGRKHCPLLFGQFSRAADNKRNSGRKFAILLAFCGRFGRFSSQCFSNCRSRHRFGFCSFCSGRFCGFCFGAAVYGRFACPFRASRNSGQCFGFAAFAQQCRPFMRKPQGFAKLLLWLQLRPLLGQRHVHGFNEVCGFRGQFHAQRGPQKFSTFRAHAALQHVVLRRRVKRAAQLFCGNESRKI